jgi:hypothetical protein
VPAVPVGHKRTVPTRTVPRTDNKMHLDERIALAIQVGEDAILVLEASIASFLSGGRCRGWWRGLGSEGPQSTASTGH